MPNTRILLDISRLTISPISFGRRVITCTKTTKYENKHFKQENGQPLAVGTARPNVIRTCDEDGSNQNNNKAITDIDKIKFNLPTALAEQLFRYLKFKVKVKEALGTFAANHVDLRNLSYDATDAGNTADTYIPIERFELEGNDTLVLDETCFTPALDDLDSIKNHFWFANVDDDKNLMDDDYASVHSPNVTNNTTTKDAFREEVRAFTEIENFIITIETLKTSLRGGVNLSTLTTLDQEINNCRLCLGGMEGRNYRNDDNSNLPNFPSGAVSPRTILNGRVNNPTSLVDINANEGVTILALRALFDLDAGATMGGTTTHYFYKEKIFGTAYTNPTSNLYGWGGYYQLLSELKIWRECGFDTITDIARANINGFFIFNRGFSENNVFDPTGMIGDTNHRGKIVSTKLDGSDDSAAANANITVIKNQLGTAKTYEGFNMINVGEKIGTASGNQATRIAELIGVRFDQDNDQEINKGRIDDFRNAMGNFGYNADGTVPTLGSDVGLEDKDTITDRKSCMGYGIEDEINRHGIQGAYALLTKVAVDILEAPDRKTAIELAFCGKDYDNNSDPHKTPNPNLELNEVNKNFFVIETNDTGDGFKDSPDGTNWRKSNPSREEILNNYYQVTKIYNAFCKWSDDKYNTTAKGEIESLYQAALIWVQIWDKWTASTKPDKTVAATDKAIVEKYLGLNGKTPTAQENLVATLNPKWKSAMEDAIAEMDQVISDIPTSKMPSDAKQELEKYKNAETHNEAKEFYATIISTKSSDDKITKAVVEKIKVIVEAVKKVLATSPSEADCNTLIAYEGSTEKAWTVAQEIEVNGKKWVGEALTKAKNRKTELLQAARTAAQTAMEGESGAYDAIGIGSETSIASINKMVEIFNQAKAAWGEKAYKDSFVNTEIPNLEKLQTQNPTEWTKVDKYKKGTAGYASGALEHLKGFKKKNETTIEELKNETTGNGVMEKYKSVDRAAGIKKEDAQRIAIYVEFKNSSDSVEKELSNLCAPSNPYHFEDTEDKLDKSLEDIKKTIEQLKAYKDAGDNDPKGKACKKLASQISELGDVKSVLDNWIRKLESRRQHLENKIKERDKDKNQNTPPKQNPWTSVPAIIAYCLLGAALIGGIAWLVLRGGEEEVGE